MLDPYLVFPRPKPTLSPEECEQIRKEACNAKPGTLVEVDGRYPPLTCDPEPPHDIYDCSEMD